MTQRSARTRALTFGRNYTPDTLFPSILQYLRASAAPCEGSSRCSRNATALGTASSTVTRGIGDVSGREDCSCVTNRPAS